MKRTRDYWPVTDSDLAVWNVNYQETIASIGQLLGLTEEEIDTQQQVSSRIMAAVQTVEMRKAQASEAIAYKNRMIKEEGTLMRKCIARMKTHERYTEALGKELGVVCSSIPVDFSKLKPELRLTAYPGFVSIAFHKYGLEGIVVYSRLKGTENWEKLGTDYASPFFDKRPLAAPNQPEIREYRAMYANMREAVGQYSNIVSIVFGG